MTVGLVLVSHSAKIAEGLVDLAGQMAGDVRLVAAGGTDEGGIGTSFDRVTAALAEADSGDGVVVLCDLGSAILTTETALDFLDDEQRDRVRIADAPLVEGAVAAAVTAATGEGLDAVLSAAEAAGGGSAEVPSEPQGSAPAESSADRSSVTVTLTNEDGLHTRPAAEFVKLASRFSSDVRVNGADAKSMLRVMGLGAKPGTDVTIEATGPDAADAVAALEALVRSDFATS
ncbi:dihydroxyacetone kinase phosphoryl donor subunit DhaM [Desertivibrio insolitus]|uniref:dihydroxyacetone kinase phosphoryl donor subunit DhaM n=1 Tax=Herbiconiux sp. SYSU D00978 TaxID=2812562 RepID=UPI001A963145|nr:dihydroxyacetone kinase phosphoryl donor subunit DhaM [Herbiconiux sp. SYSU D00978]